MTGGTKPYEERDVAFRPLVVVAAVIVGVIVGTFLLMGVLDRGLARREAERSAPANPLAESYGRREPPPPRLQDDPGRDLALLRAREQALLDGYGWIDRASGRVRVPVAHAVELLVAEGAK
jgi:hypothetical protein